MAPDPDGARERLRALSKTAGPGILFASTAIGVSHLVQSTRAGAEYGLLLIGLVLLVNLLKYPFFEYGSRYAASTGTSLIDGYRRIGRWALWLYAGITVSSMFFVTAAVGFVAAGFFENLFGLHHLDEWTVVGLFAACAAILAIGRYSALDSLIKVIAAVMLVSTVSAFAVAAWGGPAGDISAPAPDIWDDAGIFFLLALMGWMPTALDLSAWNSLWTIERTRQTGYRPTMRQTLLEFRMSYAMTAALAAMFVVLGAYVLYGTGEGLPDAAADFAHRVIDLYGRTLGPWSELLMSASAFAVMFGTVIAVFDGYTRSVRRSAQLLFPAVRVAGPRAAHAIILASLAAGSLVVVLQFGGSLRHLVDFATVLSFVVAPVIAVLNLKLARGLGGDAPSLPLRLLSYAGIAFLAAFAAVFAYTRLT